MKKCRSASTGSTTRNSPRSTGGRPALRTCPRGVGGVGGAGARHSATTTTPKAASRNWRPPAAVSTSCRNRARNPSTIPAPETPATQHPSSTSCRLSSSPRRRRNRKASRLAPTAPSSDSDYTDTSRRPGPDPGGPLHRHTDPMHPAPSIIAFHRPSRASVSGSRPFSGSACRRSPAGRPSPSSQSPIVLPWADFSLPPLHLGHPETRPSPSSPSGARPGSRAKGCWRSPRFWSWPPTAAGLGLLGNPASRPSAGSARRYALATVVAHLDDLRPSSKNRAALAPTGRSRCSFLAFPSPGGALLAGPDGACRPAPLSPRRGPCSLPGRRATTAFFSRSGTTLATATGLGDRGRVPSFRKAPIPAATTSPPRWSTSLPRRHSGKLRDHRLSPAEPPLPWLILVVLPFSHLLVGLAVLSAPRRRPRRPLALLRRGRARGSGSTTAAHRSRFIFLKILSGGLAAGKRGLTAPYPVARQTGPSHSSPFLQTLQEAGLGVAVLPNPFRAHPPREPAQTEDHAGFPSDHRRPSFRLRTCPEAEVRARARALVAPDATWHHLRPDGRGPGVRRGGRRPASSAPDRRSGAVTGATFWSSEARTGAPRAVAGSPV